MSYSLLNWNVNGLRARWDQLKRMLVETPYDIVCLQEIKCDYESADYVVEDLKTMGYVSYFNTNLDYPGSHGTAVLIKEPLKPIMVSHEHSGRIQTVSFDDFAVITVYINQGQEIDSDEYVAKLKIMNRLYNYLQGITHKPLIVCGDFNICPTGDDVWSTDHWNDDTVSCSPRERESFNRVLELNNLRNLPVVNDVRFTWYSYRHTWRKYSNGELFEHTGRYGVKCDHILTNHPNTSDVILMDHYRLPKIKPEEATSDHVAMAITIG